MSFLHFTELELTGKSRAFLRMAQSLRDDLGFDFVSIGMTEFAGAPLKWVYSAGATGERHKRIALASSSIIVDGPIRRRYLGYKKAMNEAGIADVEDLVFHDALSFDGGYRIGRRLLGRPDITAVFAVGDIMAFGIKKAMYTAGKQIPDDLSIVGFDNTKGCEFSMPALTSVDQPVYDRGRMAVQALVSAIRDEKCSLTRRTLPVSLEIRSSVAPLLAKGGM